jgi:chemotaxis protein methyltransferase CheR
MIQEHASARSADPEPVDGMSDADFAAFSRLIHQQTGIVINAAKRSMLVSRLSRRLRKLGLSDFAAYRGLLENEANDEERRELISVITTNVTSFFREPVHFDVLAGLVPQFVERTKNGNRVRIWSAGCSSGEEPYSIAMTVAEHWPGYAQADVRILATDIDPEMVAHARRGTYGQQQVGEEPNALLLKYASRKPDTQSYLMNRDLHKMLRFEELNLLQEWPFNGKFDVIFCRNVVIYFDAPTRQKLWKRFAERLHPGGTLFIGHSERVDAELERYLEPCGVTQYRRTDVPVGAAR